MYAFVKVAVNAEDDPTIRHKIANSWPPPPPLPQDSARLPC